jgi:glycine betaine/proline transport system permease protein
LAYDVLTALRRLDIGTGVEAGFAIVALAIALDRLSRRRGAPLAAACTAGRCQLLARHPYTFDAVAMVILTGLFGTGAARAANLSGGLAAHHRHFWNEVVKWINVNYFDRSRPSRTRCCST